MRNRRRVPITEPEFQFVVHRPDVEELRTIESILLLGTRGDVVAEGVVPDVAGIAEGRRCSFAVSAIRNQTESAVDLRPHSSQIQAYPDALRVFDFVHFGRTGLVIGGLEGPRRREATRVADFVTELIEEHAAVARQDLSVQLGVLVAKNDVVERTGGCG